MRERQGEASDHLKVFEKMFLSHLRKAAVAGVRNAARKGFRGLSCKDHGTKTWESGVRACNKFSRYVDSASRVHISDSKQPLRWTAAVESQAVPLLARCKKQTLRDSAKLEHTHIYCAHTQESTQK